MSRVAFVYVNYHCVQEIHRSISSISKLNFNPCIFVCDNSSDYVKKGNERVISPGENIGYLNGLNAVVTQKDFNSSVVCLVNPDIEFTPSLDKLLDINKSIVVAPSVIESDGSDQNPYKVCIPEFRMFVFNFFMLCFEFLTGGKDIFKLRKLQGKTSLHPSLSEDIVPHGSFVAFVNCDLRTLISPWNSLYFEEEKIALWSRRHGYKILYNPKVLVKHNQNSPSTRLLKPRRKILIKLKSLLELMLFFD